ncbi:E3 ISG15--protein ligase Herc6, partial [Durusdinium trenchii]
MNAFARGGLPTASAQALLQQNLEMLEDVMIEKTWSARDVSLLCNALHRLRPTTSEAERLHRFYARVLGSWAMDPPDCGPQDLAQLASSLAAVSQKYRSEVVHGFRVLLQPWTTGMAKELSWGVSLEGLCALLNALERLALLDLSLAISPAAVQRVSHAKLSASHLGHLCYIFSRWLEPKWASEAGDSLEPRGVHAQAPAPAACEMRALRVQVLELFKSTLCPAIVELASTFQRPKNVALTALALARLCRSTKDEKDEKVQRLSHEVAESLCQQSLLDRAEQSDSDSLQWCNWQSLDLAQLAESLSALLTSRMDVKLPAVATLLSSISKYLLEEVENMPIQQAIRIGAAVAPTLDGPEVCHRLAQVVAEIKFDLPIPAAALWLRTLQLLEMNEASLWQPLVWQLHRRLASTNEETRNNVERHEWSLRSASRVLGALERLGGFRHVQDGSVLFIYAKAADLLLSEGLDTSAPAALSVAELLLRTEWHQPWREWILDRVAFAALKMNVMWPKYAQKHAREMLWMRHVFLLCRLATLDVYQRGVQRSLRRAFGAFSDFDPFFADSRVEADEIGPNERREAMDSSQLCRVLAACGAAGFDLASFAFVPQKSWQAALLFPAAASSRQREITTIWNESMLEMVLDGLTTENASELSLAALLFRMKHEDHGGSDGSGSSWGNVVRAVSAVLLEALSRAEESPEVIVTLQYLRFEGLRLGVRVNKAFLLLTKCLQILLLPQLSAYQYRVYLIYILQVLGSESFQLLLAKSLQSYYYVNNLLLLLSVGSCLPFLRVVFNLWRFIPCPPMASLISNVALVFTLIFLLILGIGRFGESLFEVYIYSMMFWPWLVLTSVVSRLFIERQAGRNPFSPVKDLPILGFFGALSCVLAFMALKELTICDCLVLTVFDNVLAAAMASLLMGKSRRKRHFRAIKVYTMMCVLVALYFLGDQGLSNMSMNFPLGGAHLLWIASRFFMVTRSIYVKWKYATFHHAKEPSNPPENLLLFYANSRPTLHRFRGFPSPMLSVLDCLFDSGLRDIELHGMGPLGTEDLYNLTEFTYLLPVASLASFLMEEGTLYQGLLPQTGTTAATALGLAESAAAASAAEGAATVQVSGDPQEVAETRGSLDLLVAVGLVVVFCVSKLLTPVSMSRTLFDRASPINVWKYQPLMVAAPVFFYDVLSLNSYISKYQICVLLLLAAMNAVYRADMWNAFKRKYLLLQTQDLHYQAPSTVRQLQRKTLLQFLERTSTDDYANMLLETSIGHGTNIRELARDMSVSVWDPSPSSTAAWKLAFSLVTKSLRRQKLLRKQKMDTKQEVHRFIERIVHEMVDTAVDTAAGHGARMKLAGSLAQVTAKRRAVRRLRQHALNRRTLRAQRRAGQLSTTAAHLSTASGTLRSVQDLKRDMGPMRPLMGPGSQKPKALPAPSTRAAGSSMALKDGTASMSMSQTLQSWNGRDPAETGLSLSPSQTV